LFATGGSGDRINGIPITGMISFHNSDADIVESHFENAGDDDAINFKFSGGSITDSLFVNNISDGIDIDFPKKGLSISENIFKNNKGDAIDISFSDITISSNTVNMCGDKGISVGEHSTPYINDNYISKCAIGIAVKDSSVAHIKNNKIENNGIGISVYQKKQEFGGGIANLEDNIFINNSSDTHKDDNSSIFLNN